MPASNPAFLDTLFGARDIDIARGALFDRAPGPASPDPAFDRAAGMLLGLAIGDALGHPLVRVPPGLRAARFGEMRDFAPTEHGGDAAHGLPSSITQLAIWTLDDLTAAGRFRPKRVVDRWCEHPLFGAGVTVRDALRDARSGVPWHRCGRKSAGAGPAARVAPLLLPHRAEGDAGLWADVALGTMATHNDSAALASALGVAALLHGCLTLAPPGASTAAATIPSAAWWADTFIAVARDVEIEPFYKVPRPGEEPWRGRLWERVAATVPDALATDLGVADAAARWGSGEYALEAIPIALLILARHAADPEAALLRAANDTDAADVVGAIVGACVGALHGAAALPARWRDGLTGRTGAADDGHVFASIDAARARWGESAVA
ncbi:MAG: ADP-ribosylglycohydrolase family protein [Ardenticatenales bacterium]